MRFPKSVAAWRIVPIPIRKSIKPTFGNKKFTKQPSVISRFFHHP